MAADRSEPQPPPNDMRGIVDPDRMLRHVDFDRQPAGDALAGLVEWFWSVAWDFPTGEALTQEVLNHPAGNISVGTIDDAGVPLDPAQGRVYGVLEGVSQRHLTGAGWTVAARTTVGGLGVFLDRPARDARNQQLTLVDGLPGCQPDELVSAVAANESNLERVASLRTCLESIIEQRDPDDVAEARWVAQVASMAEVDRTICRSDELAEIANVSVRSLQRRFDRHVGQSPAFIIRRWRIIEAAESARTAITDDQAWNGWSTVAAELGYADQSHLVRDFSRHLGVTPAAYVDRIRSSR